MTSNKEVLNISGHSMAYHREGEGEPVLLVHKITTYSFIWRKIIPLLSMMYEVIAVDLPGCGESDKPLDATGGHFIQEDEPEGIAREMITFFRGKHASAG